MGHKQYAGVKEFLVLLMVFMFIFPESFSTGKAKHGAWVTVINHQGQTLEGELLEVKDNEIILISKVETGINIPVDEIRVIKYKKRGKFLTGAAIGLGISMLGGGILGNALKDEGANFIGGVFIYGAIFGIPMALVTGFLTSRMVTHKTYNFENASPEQIAANLKKLKLLARFH